jgi:hypothetical protein
MDSVNLLLSVPAVLAVVQFVKQFGVAGRWATLTALVVAVGLNVASYEWGASGLYRAVAQGLLLGLAAAGLYDAAKTAAKK